MSEDEGIDGSDADAKARTSSQAEADIDRPLDTLKPHHRSSKGFADTLQKGAVLNAVSKPSAHALLGMHVHMCVHLYVRMCVYESLCM